jgi:lipoprotein-anchoring transpeptidase ErfK/SrfK
MQIFRRPRSAQISLSAKGGNRLSVAAVAGGALLCGIAGADAFPFYPPQGAMGLPESGPRAPLQRPARPSQFEPTAPAIKPAKEHDPAAGAKNSPKETPKGTLGIIVSLDKQQLTLYADGQPIARSPVSTGKAGHSTPTGVFSIIEKDRWHHSNLYDDAPMYFMQRLTWSGVALHQGVVPNYPASHGCIRLPEAFARQLWGTTKAGVRVIIARDNVAPVEISHPRLFAPRREPLEAKVEPSGSAGQGADGTFATSRLRYATANSALIAGMTFEPRPTFISSDRFVGNLTEPAAPLVATPPAGAALPPAVKSAPISVFISRKEGRLFVRKSFEPVFDVPVTFEGPERPIGTHVFSALAVKADKNSVRWTVVSIPGPASTSSAAGALDRISIPQDAVERISELMSAGASLIISDQGRGPETGVGTDFNILTH